MKNYIIVTAILLLWLPRLQAQDTTNARRMDAALQHYYLLKDALVGDDAGAASRAALAFVRQVNGISYLYISEGNVHVLIADADAIAGTGDLEMQRRHFANLSENMALLARQLKFASHAVYLQHCPMKKASWLSASPEVLNPFYGDAMLRCGKVTERW